jgi:hypothetical protein
MRAPRRHGLSFDGGMKTGMLRGVASVARAGSFSASAMPVAGSRA